MILLAAATATLLYPVAVDDERLREDGTLVSQTAQTAMRRGEPPIYCMDLPERTASHERACLTRAEWSEVLQLAEEDAAHQSSVRQRERAIMLADIYLR